MSVYSMWFRQAAQGEWLFKNRYEIPAHSGGYFSICWGLFGQLGGLLRLSPLQIFQVIRWFSVLLLLGAFGWVSDSLIEDRWLRKLWVVLFGLGGSFGGWLFLLGRKVLSHAQIIHTAADLWSPIHPFFSIAFIPHFPFALAWFLLANGAWLSGERTKKKSLYVVSGVCIVISGLTHPYEMMTFGGTLVGVTLLRKMQKRKIGQSLWSLFPLVGILGIMGYYFWLTHLHPGFRAWKNNFTATYPIWIILLGGGPVLWLGLAELFYLLKRLRSLTMKEQWLFVWGTLSPVLLYARFLPFAFSFSTSLMLPHYFLSGRWLSRRSALRRWDVKAGTVIVTLALTLTSFLLVWEALMLPKTAFSRALFVEEDSELDPIFIPLPIKEGMVWLGRHAAKDTVVLGAWETLLQIPTYADTYVFVGHKDFSSDRYRKKLAILTFFNVTTSNEWRKSFLDREKINYLFWGPKERLAGDFRPDISPLLRGVYSKNDVSIYTVRSQ